EPEALAELYDRSASASGSIKRMMWYIGKRDGLPGRWGILSNYFLGGPRSFMLSDRPGGMSGIASLGG
ncbi:MAG: hypothetical protein ABL921_24695, partial [Pirellula sp.]